MESENNVMHNVYWHESRYLTKVSVTSGNTFHTFHAVFLPRPEKMDFLSQPVNVNHIGKALHVSSPTLYTILCIGRYFRFWSTPNTTHNLFKLKEKKWQRARQHDDMFKTTSFLSVADNAYIAKILLYVPSIKLLSFSLKLVLQKLGYLLYSSFKHFRWYTASVATMSPSDFCE